MGGHYIDLTGKRFGRLTVLEFSHRGGKSKEVFWKCKCDCGNVVSVRGVSLRNGDSRSCGCLSRELAGERVRTHGLTHHSLFNRWQKMRDRCYNPNDRNYVRYGGRGIKICDEWRTNFKAFYDWEVATGYTPELSIDRIDVNGNYCPENCRWATWKEQCYNKRETIYLTYQGETKPLKIWCDELGLKYPTCYMRFKQYGWTDPSEILFGKRKET